MICGSCFPSKISHIVVYAGADRDLIYRFGRVARVYIGKDRETGIGKGYAFVSFEEKANAERAIQKVHGMGASFISSTLVLF